MKSLELIEARNREFELSKISVKVKEKYMQEKIEVFMYDGSFLVCVNWGSDKKEGGCFKDIEFWIDDQNFLTKTFNTFAELQKICEEEGIDVMEFKAGIRINDEVCIEDEEVINEIENSDDDDDDDDEVMK